MTLTSDDKDLGDGVFAEDGPLAVATPLDVAPDEEGAAEAAEHAQHDAGTQLEHVPGRVVLHVEQHCVVRAQRVDETQHRRRHQRTEKGPAYTTNTQLPYTLPPKSFLLHKKVRYLLAQGKIYHLLLEVLEKVCRFLLC